MVKLCASSEVEQVSGGGEVTQVVSISTGGGRGGSSGLCRGASPQRGMWELGGGFTCGEDAQACRFKVRIMWSLLLVTRGRGRCVTTGRGEVRVARGTLCADWLPTGDVKDPISRLYARGVILVG